MAPDEQLCDLHQVAAGQRAAHLGQRLLLELADALARQVVLVADLLERQLLLGAEAEALAQDVRLDRAAARAGGRGPRSSAPPTRGPRSGETSSRSGSSRTSPSTRPSSSPTGLSIENRLLEQPACASSRPCRAACWSPSRAPRVVGWRPSLPVSWRRALVSRCCASIMWTGRRTSRPLSASARLIAWRIHQRRVGREAEAARVVVALDRLDEAEVALLDQVGERHAAVVEAARDRRRRGAGSP